MYDIAVLVGEDLHLDVARIDDGFLDEAGRITECAVGLAHRGLDRLAQDRRIVDPAHAAATATGDGLHEQRIAERLRRVDELVDVRRRIDRVERRHPSCLGRGDRACLVAGELEHFLGRTDERDAGGLARLGEVGVLRQEAVAGIDRVDAGLDRDVDDGLRIEIGAYGVADLADLVGLVGTYAVLRTAILDREDRDGVGSQLMGSAKRADRDLTAICHKDLLEHGPSQGSERVEHQRIARLSQPHCEGTLRFFRTLPLA